MINKKVLYIGSECIKEFGFSGKEHVALISARQDTLVSYRLLIDKRPQIYTDFILTKGIYADNVNVLIPDPQYSECKEKADNIRKVAKEFVSVSTGDQKFTLGKLDRLVSEYNIVCKSIDDYVLKNQSNWLVPKNADIMSIPGNSRAKVISILRKDGIIGKLTLPYFSSMEFLNNYIRPRVISAISDHGFIVSDASETVAGKGFFIYKSPSLRAFLKYSHFAKQFNYVILSETKMRIRYLDRIFESCQIISEFGNFLKAVQRHFIARNMRIIDYSEDANEFHFSYDGSYFRAPLSIMLNNYLSYFMDINGDLPETLISILMSSEKHSDYDDYKAYFRTYEKQGIQFFQM